MLTCFTHISFALNGHLDQFLPKYLVGRFLSQNWMLGRITRFYNRVPSQHDDVIMDSITCIIGNLQVQCAPPTLSSSLLNFGKFDYLKTNQKIGNMQNMVMICCAIQNSFKSKPLVAKHCFVPIFGNLGNICFNSKF